MSVQSGTFLDLVEQASVGTLKLPAFQRTFKWNNEQVRVLFDSIRRGYPLGGFLFAEPGLEIDLDPRSFTFALKPAESAITKFLVLDGQQRLTAGIQLFVDNAAEKDDKRGSHYFLDLGKIHEQFVQAAEADGKKKKKKLDALLDDEDWVAEVVDSIEHDSNYVRRKPRSNDPYRYLLRDDLLYTPLLVPKYQKRFEAELDKFIDANGEKKKFIRNVIKQHFVVQTGPAVPIIILDHKKTEALSRIFSTLNNTGKLLTPFELVVATLFPKNINLGEALKDAKEKYTYYPRMDKSGEIVLQTSVLLNGGDPKKSKLPEAVKADDWRKTSETSFEMLEQVGEWLTDSMGFALDKTEKFIPYDSLFVPLAFVWANCKIAEMTVTQKQKTFPKLQQFVVGACLSKRYQEGVHTKQSDDAKGLVEWISTPGDSKKPAWLTDLLIGSLKSHTPGGAIGKLVLCLLNTRKLVDPITGEKAGLGDDKAQTHHVFPRKFAPTLKDWIDGESVDVILNTMRIKTDVNVDLAKEDPARFIQRAAEGRPTTYKRIFEDQFIDEDCMHVLRKPKKAAKDFRQFISVRDELVKGFISKQYGFAIAQAGNVDGDDSDD